MLQLVEIKKNYVMKDQEPVRALRGVSLRFRQNEFVAILGPSGCGKTTLLNIIGIFFSGLIFNDKITTCVSIKTTDDIKQSCFATTRRTKDGHEFILTEVQRDTT